MAKVTLTIVCDCGNIGEYELQKERIGNDYYFNNINDEKFMLFSTEDAYKFTCRTCLKGINI